MTPCPNCARLRAENAELSRALDGAVWLRNDQAARISRLLGVSQQQGQLLSILYDADAPMTGTELSVALPRNDHAEENDQFSKFASVVICNIRVRLGKSTVKTLPRHGGYVLGDFTRERIKEMLDAKS